MLFRSTYVIAAASLAYWGLCKSGIAPRDGAALIETTALSMIDTVRRQFEERKALADAAAKKAVSGPVPADGNGDGGNGGNDGNDGNEGTGGDDSDVEEPVDPDASGPDASGQGSADEPAGGPADGDVPAK